MAASALGGSLAAHIHLSSACLHGSKATNANCFSQTPHIKNLSHVWQRSQGARRGHRWAVRRHLAVGLARDCRNFGLCVSGRRLNGGQKGHCASASRTFAEARDTACESTVTRAGPSHKSEETENLSDESDGHSADPQLLKRRDLVLIACTTPLIHPLSSLAESAVASPEPLTESKPQSTNLPEVGTESVRLVIGDKCDLGVSIYPDFEYNAGGKGGVGFARKESDGRIFVHFDPATLEIPPVQFDTTKFLTLPVPPPLKIEIVSKKLEGYIEPETGKVELDFLAEFLFTIGPLYKAKPLVVGTTLTTESSQGPLRSGQGQRLDRDGRCVLAGVARVVPVDDPLLDPFLMLPTDCLAKLPATFIFSSSQA